MTYTEQELIDKLKTIPDIEVGKEGKYLLIKVNISGIEHEITTPYVPPYNYYPKDYIDGYYEELKGYIQHYIKENNV